MKAPIVYIEKLATSYDSGRGIIDSMKLYRTYKKHLDSAMDDTSIPEPYEHALQQTNASPYMGQLRIRFRQPGLKMTGTGSSEAQILVSKEASKRYAGGMIGECRDGVWKITKDPVEKEAASLKTLKTVGKIGVPVAVLGGSALYVNNRMKKKPDYLGNAYKYEQPIQPTV